MYNRGFVKIITDYEMKWLPNAKIREFRQFCWTVFDAPLVMCKLEVGVTVNTDLWQL